MEMKVLVGSGRKIGLFTLPFLAVGILLNILFPAVFDVGPLSRPWKLAAALVLIFGVIVWIWTVYLILTRIPQRRLIVEGPYAIVKHPLYAGVAILVLPWAGILCHTWLGILIGATVYLGSRMYSPEEEKMLANVFGASWFAYTKKVKLPWL